MSQGFLNAFLTMRQTVNGTSVAHKKKQSIDHNMSRNLCYFTRVKVNVKLTVEYVL